MTATILCACTKLACEGICREKHLYRKRKGLDQCPAAYNERSRKEAFHDKGKV